MFSKVNLKITVKTGPHSHLNKAAREVTMPFKEGIQ
jgi:hypothetical protein